MTAQLVYRVLCEHGELRCHYWCSGGSEVVLDPDRLVEGVWVVDAEGDTAVVRLSNVAVGSFIDALGGSDE